MPKILDTARTSVSTSSPANVRCLLSQVFVRIPFIKAIAKKRVKPASQPIAIRTVALTAGSVSLFDDSVVRGVACDGNGGNSVSDIASSRIAGALLSSSEETVVISMGFSGVIARGIVNSGGMRHFASTKHQRSYRQWELALRSAQVARPTRIKSPAICRLWFQR